MEYKTVRVKMRIPSVAMRRMRLGIRGMVVRIQ
jgi:hypothetical protein